MLEKKKRPHSEDEDEILHTAAELFRPPWLQDEPSLWPRVQKAMAAPAEGERSAPRKHRIPAFSFPASASASAWKWSAAALGIGLISLGLALVGLRSHIARPGTQSTPALMAAGLGPRIEILSSVLAGSPAKSFLFQTEGTSYVWLAPEKGKGKAK
jgi:hypothetical protein